MTITMVILCISLGIWQTNRLIYKERILKQIEENYFLEPIDFEFVNDYANDRELSYLHVQLKGHFLTDKKIFITPKIYQGELGYHLLIPFQLLTNEIIWVNLGWLSRHIDSNKIHIPTKNIMIRGHIYHPSQKKNFFTLENPKLIGIEHPWYSYQLSEMNEISNINADEKIMIFLDEENFITHKEKYIYPIPGQLNINIPNKHLQYLLTWFSFAIVFVVMYIIYVKKHKNA